MSEYITTPRSSGPRSSSVATYVSGTTANGQRGPRGSYESGNSIVPGLFVWAKANEKVPYYYYSDGKQQVKGDNKNDDPVRNGGEFVGVTTGNYATSAVGKLMLEVSWEQRWYTARFLGMGTKGETRQVLSWVEVDAIEFRVAQSPDNVTVPPTSGGNPPSGSVPPPATGSNEVFTLAAVGVAGALLLTPKSKKRR